MFIISEEYFYKKIIESNIAEIDECVRFKESAYCLFAIPKKGGKRYISGISPEYELYYMQKHILDNFLSKIELPLCVKGFIKNGSYTNYLTEHINKRYYLRMDIKSFFDTISSEKIKDSFEEYIKFPEALYCFIEICTLKDKLPQGAITSPAISNIIFRRIDQRITKYCQKFNVSYTRYADDLLFSSNNLNFKEKKWFYKKIKYILKSNGFESNYSKKRVGESEISLGGYVLEKDVHLSRKKLNELNKILYYFKDTSNVSKYVINRNILKTDYINQINKLQLQRKKFKDKTDLINYLCGYRAFIISVIKANNKKMRTMSNKIKQIEKLVKELEQA